IIDADFAGTNGFEDSSGFLGGIQVQDGTSTALSSTPNPSTFGQSVSFTAIVSAADSGAGTPTGSVQFSEGATVLATVTLDGGVHASFSTPTLSASSHTITAAFTGTGGWLNSSTSASQTVTKSDTATSVSSSANPAVFGQTVTYTATITAIAPGA